MAVTWRVCAGGLWVLLCSMCAGKAAERGELLPCIMCAGGAPTGTQFCTRSGLVSGLSCEDLHMFMRDTREPLLHPA